MGLTKFIINKLMPTAQQIKKYQEKVLHSQCFSKSAVVKELLKYLVEQSLQGESPKEFEIAYEVFGQKDNRSKEKNIRIYVHNLRKKLDEYYEREGASDEMILSIPKGGYLVVFTLNKKVILQTKIAKLSPVVLGISIVILFLSIVIFSSGYRSKVTRNFMWKEFYSSHFPTLIIMGDHYFVNTKNALGVSATRFYDINSDEEFDEFVKGNPELAVNFQKTTKSYINEQGPYCLYKVMSFLGGGEVDIDLRYSSNLEWEHLTDVNSIFIGSYKTQNILKKAYEKIGISYNIPETKLLYEINDTTLVFRSTYNDFLLLEYATFMYFKTSDDRNTMTLMCNSDIGNVATIKYLSEPKNLKLLKQKTKDFPSGNFKAIFEVQGKQETEFKIVIKRIDPIEINIDEVWP